MIQPRALSIFAPFGRRTYYVAGVVVASLALRLVYLWLVQRMPGFGWIDPDGYPASARLFLVDGGRWHWNLEAVRYSGPFFKAPLYPALLSVFAAWPVDYHWSAALAHAVLGTVSVAALWSIARDLHSEKAGLIAATAYAVYFPAVVSVDQFMQERLYVPLLIVAFAVLARAITTGRRWTFAVAGVAFGLAALARSMPVYYVGPAAVLLLATSNDRRQGFRLALLFLAGFTVLVLPYSVFMSRQAHETILIENIGAFGLARSNEFFGNGNASLSRVAQFVWRGFSQDPLAFVKEKVDLILGMFQLGASRWLVLYTTFPTALAALAGKILAHIFGDGLFLVLAFAGPVGFAIARRRDLAGLVALWMAIHGTFTVLSGYSGQRFREPIDWGLLVLASCIAAGKWRRPQPLAFLVCCAVALSFGWSAVKSVPAAMATRADYGVGAWVYDDEHGRATTAKGHAGFNVLPVDGLIDVLVREPKDSRRHPLLLSIDGVPLASAVADADEHRWRVPYRKDRAFVEIEAPESSALEIEAFDYPARRVRAR